MSESNENGHTHGGRVCPPQFPIFPIVFPMIFPIGATLLMKRVRGRKRGSLKHRLAKIEERLDALTEKQSD
jgi:hypothetical protein